MPRPCPPYPLTLSNAIDEVLPQGAFADGLSDEVSTGSGSDRVTGLGKLDGPVD
jgi:hypothetical protein